MNSFLGLENISETAESGEAPDSSQPRILFELEPWVHGFRRNLADLLFRRQPPPVALTSLPADFWPDVFVTRRLPWGAFAESVLYHAIVLMLLWGYSVFLFRPQPRVQARRFDPSDVIYYSPSEYLPPLDTGAAPLAKPLKGEPEFARQPILSVPPESDNRHQTIVTPPDIQLTHDVDMPNIVAWGNHSVPVPGSAIERKTSQLPILPSQIVAPAPDVYQAPNRNLASLAQGVVAPAPNVPSGTRAVASLSYDVVAPAPDANSALARQPLRGPESSVVEPPPAVNAASVRKLGDINIGRSEVVAPAPQLPVGAQRTLSPLTGSGKSVVPPPPSTEAAGPAGTDSGHGVRSQTTLGGSAEQVVPPPPSVSSGQSAEAGGRIIALGIHPSAALPPELPQGNRRGTFAATPEGKAGAPGTPDVRGDPSLGTNGHGMGTNGNRGAGGSGSADVGVPPGLHVGAAANPPASTVTGTGGSGAGEPSSAVPGQGKTEMASASTAHSRAGTGASPAPKADLVENPTPLERQVFHDRRLYSMTLNMPNLNSAGGSWVIRFAELGDNREKGDLIAPVADHKVDPAYPMQLMRENVAGTVTLRAIIRADGTVGDIRVVNGADARLDHYATQALSRWHFRPAMKNDANIDVEAIVMIPFKPILRSSPF